MDRRQDQVILVEQRHAGLVAGGVGRIERQFGQETLARADTRRRSAQAAPDRPAASTASSWMRSRCGSYQSRASSNSAGQPSCRPASAGACRRSPAQSSPARGGGGASERPTGRRLGRWHRARAGRCRPDAGQKLQHAKSGDAVTAVFAKAQQRQHILDVRRFEEFQAAEFDERDIAPGQFDLERAAVMRGAKQHGLCLERQAALAVVQNALDDETRLLGFVRHAHQKRTLGRRAIGPQVFGEPLGGKFDHRRWRPQGSAASSGSYVRA